MYSAFDMCTKHTRVKIKVFIFFFDICEIDFIYFYKKNNYNICLYENIGQF